MKSITKVEEEQRRKEKEDARRLAIKNIDATTKRMKERIYKTLRSQERVNTEARKREEIAKRKLKQKLEKERKEALTAWERPAFDGRGRPTGLLQSVMPKSWPVAQQLKKKLHMKDVRFISALARDIRNHLKVGGEVFFNPVFNGVTSLDMDGRKIITSSYLSKHHFALMIPLRIVKVDSRYIRATLARAPEIPFDGLFTDLSLPIDAAGGVAVFKDIIIVFHDRVKYEYGRVCLLSKNPEIQDNEFISVYKIQFKKAKKAV